MPIFDYECKTCGAVNDFLVFESDKQTKRQCGECGELIDLVTDKLPGAASFKIKGLRAENGYGLKFQDSYGVNKVDGRETGYSFTSNKGGVADHNQGQDHKAQDKRSMAERKADNGS